VFRRWRHLLVFLCSLFALTLAMDVITEGMTRPRPYGVLIIAGWAGYSASALSVTILAFLLMSIAYCLVVPGRPRTYAKVAIAVIVIVFCLACQIARPAPGRSLLADLLTSLGLSRGISHANADFHSANPPPV
jgi:hypothetical protein